MTNHRPEADEAARETARALAGAGHYIDGLPGQERRIAELAADGVPVWSIAAELGISDAAVSSTLARIVAVVAGRSGERVEVGGLGSDTDPGIHGGYDEAPWEAYDGPGDPEPSRD